MRARMRWLRAEAAEGEDAVDEALADAVGLLLRQAPLPPLRQQAAEVVVEAG
jgi:hypothetical protein